MTERAGAALSHVPIRPGRIAFFSASGAANFSALAGSGGRLAEIARWQFVPPPDAWLHEPYAGNAGFGRVISTARNTWRILVFSDENFVFQYFRVIIGIFFNSQSTA
jgi:hypothetical protein